MLENSVIGQCNCNNSDYNIIKIINVMMRNDDN